MNAIVIVHWDQFSCLVRNHKLNQPLEERNYLLISDSIDI